MVKKFGKNPSQKNALHLDKSTQMLFYAWATYVVEKKDGDIDKARKIREVLLPEMKKTICIDQRGLRSIFLGCRLLTMLDFGKDTSLDIYIKNKKAFQVFYNADPSLSNMFFVNQTHTMLGVDKELTLYYEGIRDYFKDTFMDFPDMRVDKIDMVIQSKTKPFYRKELGVIWNEEKCAECTSDALAGKISKKCKKLIEAECYTNFRHAPQFVFKDIHDEKKPAKAMESQADKWECSSCMLMNPKNAKKCIACGTPR